jgi:hemolysin III
MSAQTSSPSSTTDCRPPLLARAIREPANGLTHLAGVLLAIAACVALVWAGIRSDNPLALIGLSVFGVSQIGLYTASTLYHSLRVSPAGVARLRRIDHMMVFVLIAGTYTPICLVALRGGWGWSLFGVVWGIALGGLIIKTRWMHAPKWLSTALYLAMGWAVIVAAPVLYDRLPAAAVGWLLAGGIIYSIGAVIYALKRPNLIPGVFDAHALWHLFVLAGSACFFWMIVQYVA